MAKAKSRDQDSIQVRHHPHACIFSYLIRHICLASSCTDLLHNHIFCNTHFYVLDYSVTLHGFTRQLPFPISPSYYGSDSVTTSLHKFPAFQGQCQQLLAHVISARAQIARNLIRQRKYQVETIVRPVVSYFSGDWKVRSHPASAEHQSRRLCPCSICKSLNGCIIESTLLTPSPNRTYAGALWAILAALSLGGL